MSDFEFEGNLQLGSEQTQTENTQSENESEQRDQPELTEQDDISPLKEMNSSSPGNKNDNE